jgi:transcriptional regulator with XRE-family HTH domain
MNPLELRHKLGINQSDFWARVGVTQSGGSRYEAGRRLPRPVAELLRLCYIENIDLSQVTKDDVLISRYLKENFPEQYRALRKSARAAFEAGEALKSMAS